MGRDPAWREFRETEFKRFITSLCASARRRRFSVWTGDSKDPFSVAVSAWWGAARSASGASESPHVEAFCIRMDPKSGYRYMLAEKGDYRPGKVARSAYATPIGSTPNEATEHAVTIMDHAIARRGLPTGEPSYETVRFYRLKDDLPSKMMSFFMQQTDWDQTPWDERHVTSLK